ncbi:gamma-glutamylcyclotransferase family protein [Planctomicrobium sp. SH668]|uniref:gamma-glutamylcyclotransferase family protein n=1 Tax=Planctomicrobium sp. SH668 TaxID=3448126 RepID=UPI003F5C888B
MPTLFIYGTLKRNFCRHNAISEQVFLGNVTTVPRYRLVNIGDYPGLIDAPGDGVAVEGELWEVSEECLAELDIIEEVEEGEYERKAIHLADETRGPAEAYFYCRTTLGLRDCGPVWV